MYISGILATHLPKIMAECKAYKEKVMDLFITKDSHEVSLNHLYKNIIINPKALFNLVESNFLLQKKIENLSAYYQLKTEILKFIHFLVSDFPLNAKLIYEDPFLVIEHNKRINFITYLIKDVKEAFKWQANSNAEDKLIFKKYHETSTAIFYSICQICTLKTSELKLIANTLTDFYYEEQLYTNMIGHCFKLLSTALQGKEIMPFISFIDHNKAEAVRLLMKDSQWTFSKGMTSFLWINPQKCSDFQLLRLRSAEGESMVVKFEGSRLSVISSTQQSRHQQEFIEITALPNEISMIGIELEPKGGIFNSDGYHLNIKVNDQLYSNVAQKIPKFQDVQLLAQCCFLHGFIGKLYGIIITSVPSLKNWEQLTDLSKFGPYSEHLAQNLLKSQILDQDDILCVFNPQRSFQGLLINYANSNDYASCEGRMFGTSYHSYGSKLVDIYLPFFYFTSLVKDKNEELYKLFDTIFRHILEIITKQNYEIQSVLLLLYFLQINQYKISQQTWNILYNHHTSNPNFYLKFVIDYLDIQMLVRNGLEVDEAMEPFSNPVEKLIFMFHLETLWKQKWNELQGFEGWWSPHFFQPQNDRSFDPKDFEYNKNKQSRVQWSVLNLVTKDYCKSFVQPIFILPKYAQCDKYQRQYSKKQCFSSNFSLNLNKKMKYEKIICKKTSNSKFDKLKNKIFGRKQHKIEYPKKKTQQIQIKQFESQCIFIDILEVVEGSITINKQGFIIFHSAHKNKDFDHMCAKAFKNQVFYYFNIPFSDVKQIYKKRFNASNNAIYIKTQDGKQMLFHFYLKNVDVFLGIIQNFVKVKKDAFSNYLNSDQPLRWIDKYMSNYEYLQWLNEIAGRNYNDITQYPVLPWVFIGDDQQITQQQVNPNNYRDLSKNIGSHGEQDRIKQFLQKYEHNNEEQLFSQYHFGTHYSSSAIIFNFLIRIRPYSIGALALQSGKFDCADRIFHNYCGSWQNATTSTTDIRELIPQIYTLPEMFINKNNYYYGVTQDKVEVDNAILPKWAKNNPFYFVAQLRKQLERRYVSQNINHWIDLIYGYKQRGKDAVESMNIFYPLTYENCIDLDQVTEKAERISFETQIAHFGQNPSQIIGNNPHPARKAIKAQWQQKLVADGSKMLIQTCFLQRQDDKQEIILFNSVFEGKNAVLGAKFINDHSFFVMRKNQYYLFQILNKKTDFMSKEQEVSFENDEEKTSLNLKQISSFLPIASINEEVVIVGGYYSGFCSIIFLKEPKYNRNFQFHSNTVTALNYEATFQTLFVGDVLGYLKVYRVSLFPKHVEFQFINSIKAHDSKINDITINTNANIVCTCSEDGFANIYNLYSHAIIRTFHHPSNLPIHFAHITTNPLYAIVFYSKENSTVYIYSINGQFLDSIIEKTGFIYNMRVMKATDSTECLVYLNSQKELFIWELPFLRLKRKVKIRKDQNKISCFEACNNGKVIITGTNDGSLHIIANPESY